MKRLLFIALAVWATGGGAWQNASAQVDINFDFDIYPDYYNDHDEAIYRYGFNINNYAYQYEDRFVRQVANEYGIRRTVIRRYLRRGFSPSDILFGAELAERTGRPFQFIMNGYYASSSRDWIGISVSLGIPYGSPRFNLILGNFNRYYRDWGSYYHHYHPHSLPPMYHHGWSYFRPSSVPRRPPQYSRPDHRPNRPGNVSRPPQGNNRPGSVGRPESSRPESRPDNPQRPGSLERPQQPGRNTRPTQPTEGSYRRGNSSTNTPPSRSESNNSTRSSEASSGSRSNSGNRSGSSAGRSGSGNSSRRTGSSSGSGRR